MFYFLFQVMIGRGAGMQNFAIHLFAGMVLVNFFTETVQRRHPVAAAATRALITKMAMPREMFPVAAMLVSLWHAIPMLVILVDRLRRPGSAWTARLWSGRVGMARRCSASRSSCVARHWRSA